MYFLWNARDDHLRKLHFFNYVAASHAWMLADLQNFEECCKSGASFCKAVLDGLQDRTSHLDDADRYYLVRIQVFFQ